MYDLFIRVAGSKNHIIKKFKEFVMQQGKNIITDKLLVGEPPIKKDGKVVPSKNQGDPVKFTEALLALKYRADKFIIKSFNNDMEF